MKVLFSYWIYKSNIYYNTKSLFCCSINNSPEIASKWTKYSDVCVDCQDSSLHIIFLSILHMQAHDIDMPTFLNKRHIFSLLKLKKYISSENAWRKENSENTEVLKHADLFILNQYPPLPINTTCLFWRTVKPVRNLFTSINYRNNIMKDAFRYRVIGN